MTHDQGTYYFRSTHGADEESSRGPYDRTRLLSFPRPCGCCLPAWRGDDGGRAGLLPDDDPERPLLPAGDGLGIYEMLSD